VATDIFGNLYEGSTTQGRRLFMGGGLYMNNDYFHSKFANFGEKSKHLYSGITFGLQKLNEFTLYRKRKFT